MASIRRVGKKYVAEVRRRGFYGSKRFNSKHEAQRWALDTEQRIGASPAGSASHSLREAMQKYSKEVSPSKKGHRWEEIRLKKMERDPLADQMLVNLVHDDIQAWINRQTISPASVRRELALLSSVLRVARVEWKWMAHDPTADIKKPPHSPARDRLINDDELPRLLLALEYDEAEPITTPRQIIAVTLLLALETAMRHGELWGLDWQWIQLERKFLTLPETKNGTKRNVPLSSRAIELLEKLAPKPAGSVLNVRKSVAEVMFRRAVQLAGIEDLHFHDSRHTAITRLARKLDVLDLARMVGHKDLRSLMIYYNATAEDIAKRLD